MTESNSSAPAWAKPLALAAVAALALGLLWSTQAAADVRAYDEVRVTDPWAERGTFFYEPLLADGSGALAQGEPGYFTTSAPVLRVRFVWTLEDPAAERVTALGTLRLKIHQEAASGRPAWTHEEELANATLAGAGDEALAIQGDVDFAAAQARAEAAPGRRADGAAWTVIADVRFASAPVSAHARDASEFSMPISYAPPLYVLPHESALALHKDHATRDVIHHEERAGVRAWVGQPAGPVLVFAALAVLSRTIPILTTRPEEVPA